MIQICVNLLLSVMLIIMAIQDFCYRAITWYAFPLLAVLLVLSSTAVSYFDVGLNIGFVVLNYLLATLIISIKYKRRVNLMKAHLGLGDLLMLLCLSLYFSLPIFFLFYLGSLLFIAACCGIYLVAYKPKDFTVPLAGLQSLLFLVLLSFSWIRDWDLNNCIWLQKYL